jgi:hypothetical protein
VIELVELGLFGAGAFATLLLGIVLARSRPPRSGEAITALLGAGAITALAGWWWTPPPSEREVVGRPIALASDGYVGSGRCRACHPDQHASWSASWHRTMTQVATPESVVGDFDDVEVSAYGQHYQLERRGDGYWVELEDPEFPGPGPGPRVWRRIAITTGSHHEQDYWFETGDTRRLGFLPLMYLREERRWIPFSAGFLRPEVVELPDPAALDRWHVTCIKCHTTHGRPRTEGPFTTRTMDTTVAEFGIACEACHGPGADHSAANRSLVRRYRLHWTDAADPTIVNPARLDAERASQVCGRCHGIHVTPEPLPEVTRVASDWRDVGFAYRPGDDLEATRLIVDPDRRDSPRLAALFADPHYGPDRFWADGMVRVSGREYNGLLRSPCFERARGERRLACQSCHSMHASGSDPRDHEEWADDQLRPGARGDAVCLECHGKFDDPEDRVAHTRHSIDSSGSECMNCHMPYTTYGLLKAIRSHTISNPSVAESRDSGRPNACNHCHLDKTLAWTAGALGAWTQDPSPPIPPMLARVPISLVWALAGDAGQRALVAWSMGWRPAMAASQQGEGWMTPVLVHLLMDPYPAVRAIAARSLARQPGFSDVDVDAWAPPAERRDAAKRAFGRWATARSSKGEPLDLAFLFTAGAPLPPDLLDRLQRQRNDRRVDLAE